MKTTTASLQKNILSLSEDFILKYQEVLEHLPLVEVDKDWPSPCIQGQFNEELMLWRPIKVEKTLSFDNIEQALELTIHPSITQYYSIILSESIPVTCNEGHLQLLFAWSEDDFARLQQNLIGHVLMKQKLKQEVTLFFAVTDEEDIMLCVNNESGEVWAERVGCKPHKKIANSLNEFILTLQPDIYVEEEK